MSEALQQYLEAIKKATKTPGIYAYRGHKKDHYKLRSSAVRRLIEQYGERVLEKSDFPHLYLNYHKERLLQPARARQVNSSTPESDMQLLAKLQHLGAATGLLDFSWSPLVALWMACQDTVHNGRVYIVNTAITSDVARMADDPSTQTVEATFIRSASAPRLWYWEPPASGEAQARILMQRSVFIIGRPLIPDSAAHLVQAIPVDKKDKEDLVEDLKLLDTTESSLFRDIPGLAQTECVRTPIHRWRNPQHSLLQGNRFHQERKFRDAIEAYTDSIGRAPDVCEPYFLRGNSRAAVHAHQEAIEDYDDAIKRLSLPYLHSKRETARVGTGFVSQIYFNRGNSNAALEDHTAAVGDYCQALRVDPQGGIQRFSGVYFNRGNSKFCLRQFEAAIQDYNTAIGLGLVHAHFNKANALTIEGRFAEAKQCYLSIGGNVDYREFVDNNLANIGRVLAVLGGQGSARVEEIEGKTSIHGIVVQVPGALEEEWRVPVFVGNVGNTGNFGGEMLAGGEGGAGKPMFTVRAVR